MRIYFIFFASAFLSLLVSTGTIYSQTGRASVNAYVELRANVVTSIELITVKSITLSNLQPGQLEINVSSVNDPNAGYMIAVGNPGAEFRLNFEQQRILRNVSGPGFLTFQYELSGNDQEDQSSAEIVDQSSKTLTFNNEGKYFIWVGGRLNIRNAQPGNYDGDFTIEIEYI